MWNEFNSYPQDLRFVHWSAFLIQDSHAGTFMNGNYVGIGGDVLMVNFPFWIFFVAIAVNFYFMVRFYRNNNKP